jgi:hypothetical protein
MFCNITYGKNENGDGEARFKFSEDFANLMLSKTKCPKDRIDRYFDLKTNEFLLDIDSDDNFEVEKKWLDQIFASLTEEEFMDKFGKAIPAEAHQIVTEEYGVPKKDEWFVALSIVNIAGFISNPVFCYRTIEEDIEAGDCIVYTVRTKKEGANE